MKHLIILSAILITFSVNAQWSFNSTSTTGIESPTNTASGEYSIAMGYNTTASDFLSTSTGYYTTASGEYSTAMGSFATASGAISTAMGSETTASGAYSTAMGWVTTASGRFSTVMGFSTEASDWGTLAIGNFNTADTSPNPDTFDIVNRAFIIGNGTDSNNKSDAMTVLFDGTTTIAGVVSARSFKSNSSEAAGSYATAFGKDTNASGHYSTAMGDYTTASGAASTAIGSNTAASGDYSTAMGFETTASGIFSTVMGYFTTASGYYSTAMGFGTTAEDHGTFSIGRLNTASTSPNPDTFDIANRAFVIGNGIDESNRSDAMTVLFDGTTIIAGDLTINSDARLKSNIISLGSTLAKLLALDGKSYTLKADESKQKIGLLAQDVQEVFPELVKEATNKQGTLSVNYQGLIPVLINAIKEQDDKIKRLEALVEKLIKL